MAELLRNPRVMKKEGADGSEGGSQRNYDQRNSPFSSSDSTTGREGSKRKRQIDGL